jgi:Flp pilus assembly pilin Flp
MSTLLRRLYAGERGQDLIEYALLASLISVSSIIGLILLGDSIFVMWIKLWSAFAGA